MNEAGLDLVFYNGGTCYGHAVGLVREERLRSTPLDSHLINGF